MKRGFGGYKREDIYRKWDHVEPGEKKYVLRDILIMIAAAFSIILPWVFAILGSFALIILLFRLLL